MRAGARAGPRRPPRAGTPPEGPSADARGPWPRSDPAVERQPRRPVGRRRRPQGRARSREPPRPTASRAPAATGPGRDRLRRGRHPARPALGHRPRSVDHRPRRDAPSPGRPRRAARPAHGPVRPAPAGASRATRPSVGATVRPATAPRSPPCAVGRRRDAKGIGSAGAPPLRADAPARAEGPAEAAHLDPHTIAVAALGPKDKMLCRDLGPITHPDPFAADMAALRRAVPEGIDRARPGPVFVSPARHGASARTRGGPPAGPRRPGPGRARAARRGRAALPDGGGQRRAPEEPGGRHPGLRAPGSPRGVRHVICGAAERGFEAVAEAAARRGSSPNSYVSAGETDWLLRRRRRPRADEPAGGVPPSGRGRDRARAAPPSSRRAACRRGWRARARPPPSPSGRIRPPSTTIGVPVTWAASSEARDSAAWATSRGVPSRPMGIARSVAATNALPLHAFGQDAAMIDRVDRDAGGCGLQRRRPGEADDARPRGRVAAAAGARRARAPDGGGEPRAPAASVPHRPERRRRRRCRGSAPPPSRPAPRSTRPRGPSGPRSASAAARSRRCRRRCAARGRRSGRSAGWRARTRSAPRPGSAGRGCRARTRSRRAAAARAPRAPRREASPPSRRARQDACPRGRPAAARGRSAGTIGSSGAWRPPQNRDSSTVREVTTAPGISTVGPQASIVGIRGRADHVVAAGLLRLARHDLVGEHGERRGLSVHRLLDLDPLPALADRAEPDRRAVR